MANIDFIIASINNGQVTVELRWNDANGFLSRVRTINNSAENLNYELSLGVPSPLRRTIGSGTTENFNPPPNTYTVALGTLDPTMGREYLLTNFTMSFEWG